MKTYFQIFLLNVISMLASHFDCFAADQNRYEFWNKAIAQKTVKQIAAQFVSSGKLWPHIDAAGSAQEWEIELVKQLHRIVTNEFDFKRPATEEEIKAHSEIANALSSAGGYSNDLLADVIYRLIVFREAQMLADSLKNLERVQKICETVSVPSVMIKERLMLYSSRDDALAKHIDVIEEIVPSDNIYIVSQKLLGLRNWTSVVMNPDKTTFEYLLTNPSGLNLTFRMAQTDMLQNMSLKAFIYFLKKGGSLENLDPGDVTRFYEIMAGSEKRFAYPILGVRRLSTDTLLGFLEIYRNQDTRNFFLGVHH